MPGTIQQHGALLAADPSTMKLFVASANVADFLSQFSGAESVIGCSISSVFGQDFVEALQRRLAAGRLRGAAPWQLTLTPLETQFRLNVSVHAYAGLVLIEVELAGLRDEEQALNASRQMQEAIIEFQEDERDLLKLSATAAKNIRILLNYERVLIYRFDAEWNGQAIAEDKVDDWEQSLVGLHFPASDIPAQARALYTRSPLRWVASRDLATVPFIQDGDWKGIKSSLKPVDLSFARLRSLSPVHMQYHRNMGVNGSMSLSILHDRKLWGLVVCHHRHPHHPSAGQRAAAIALTDSFGTRVGSAELSDTEHERQTDLTRLAALLKQASGAEHLTDALTIGRTTIADLFNCSGTALIDGNRFTILGQTPPEKDVRDLAKWLAGQYDAGKIFSSDRLPKVFPEFDSHADIASGVLAMFLSVDRSNLVLWFRPEEPQLVTWGGEPNKHSADGTTVLPRLSFERWVETRHGIARPWLNWELEIAEALRHGITDVIIQSLSKIADLNERLRQSQKMEAVGQLTGGLAHDFNNLLTGIIGSLDVMGNRITQGRFDELNKYMEAARSSSDRAARLIDRLLSFSRRQTLDPKPVDVARLAASMEELVCRTVGPSIHVEFIIPNDIWTTICDGNQLDNALLNLALNAKDAMPDGGRMTIEASNVSLDEAYASRHHEVAAGDYVVVSVTDTGAGMSADVISHVFEPFYTTKPLGEGTGLGLSMVYGFVKQSNGYTGIYSELGQGTTVRMYLPKFRGLGEIAAELSTIDSADANAVAGDTVLVIDDEVVVRMLIGDILTELGYIVLEAEDGHSALKVLKSGQRIDMLITDVGLPGGLNGRQIADAALITRPRLRILFITGYAENAALGNGLLQAGMEIMTKPFSLDVLAAKVKAMMSAP